MHLKFLEREFKSDSLNQNKEKKRIYIYIYINISDTLCAFCQCFIASFLRLVTSFLHRYKEVHTNTYTPAEFTPAVSQDFSFTMGQQAPSGPARASSLSRIYDHIRHITLGRNPLDE
jgi:hypothetical protein